MSEAVTLRLGDLEAEIFLKGAWLSRFEQSGMPLLFPRQSYELPDGTTKVRGGCHICLPNFGPGGESGLPQHGFARDEEWQCHTQSASEVVLGLTVRSGQYVGLVA